MHKVILASKSPRRSELLKQIGIDFEVMVSDKEEVITNNIPGEVVKELSYQKAMDVKENYCKDNACDCIIIGADTVVAIEDRILGKPVDENDAVNTLLSLSNKAHDVYTGVTIVVKTKDSESVDAFYVKTKVYMYDNSKEELEAYVKSGEPMDKAGSYGIQGLGAKLVEKIDGDYNNVVGLPVSEIYQRIKRYL